MMKLIFLNQITNYWQKFASRQRNKNICTHGEEKKTIIWYNYYRSINKPIEAEETKQLK